MWDIQLKNLRDPRTRTPIHVPRPYRPNTVTRKCTGMMKCLHFCNFRNFGHSGDTWCVVIMFSFWVNSDFFLELMTVRLLFLLHFLGSHNMIFLGMSPLQPLFLLSSHSLALLSTCHLFYHLLGDSTIPFSFLNPFCLGAFHQGNGRILQALNIWKCSCSVLTLDWSYFWNRIFSWKHFHLVSLQVFLHSCPASSVAFEKSASGLASWSLVSHLFLKVFWGFWGSLCYGVPRGCRRQWLKWLSLTPRGTCGLGWLAGSWLQPGLALPFVLICRTNQCMEDLCLSSSALQRTTYNKRMNVFKGGLR